MMMLDNHGYGPGYRHPTNQHRGQRSNQGYVVGYSPFSVIAVYCKVPEYSELKHCCNYTKIRTVWLYRRIMSPKDADGMANSVVPDRTAPRSSPIWVYTVCPDLSV